MEKVSIIGSGFSSLAAACYMAKNGYDVNVYEKNNQIGGRASQLKKDGFTFDMGPTWYWMPDVFERFFNDFGKSSADYYSLEKLSPGYRVFFGEDDFLDIEDSLERIYDTFEKIEKGAAAELKKFIEKAKSNYDIAIKDLVYNPGVSALELVTKETVKELKQFYLTISDYTKKHFNDHRLQKVLEFPVLFLGAKPSNTPLFYSFMNYADFGLGTWYPKGGMRSVVGGIEKLAIELGVKFHLDSPVSGFNFTNKSIDSLVINEKDVKTDLVISGADYKHTEDLLPQKLRSYSEKYWDKRVMAPSALLFYIGFDKKLDNLLHHTLFFDEEFDQHAEEIYDEPQWPKKPLFYASFPSLTDAEVAPVGKESAILLIPIAPDLEDTEALRAKYFDMMMERLEKLTKQTIKSSVIFKESYCLNEFKEDYNSYKGNAYGMANTLFQTAFLRPKIKNKKINNLYHTGQLTVPGPGVPPALISGKLVSDLIKK